MADAQNKEGTSIKHFFKMIKDTGKKIDSDFLFYPETSVHISDEIKFPCITYRVYSREPYQGHKPRRKDTYQSEEDKSQTILKYSQMFAGTIEFAVWGKSYNTVDDKREWFEKFMLRYTDLFRKEGMLEIIFREQQEDQIVEIKGNDFIKQPLIYYFRNERVLELPVDNINSIETVNSSVDNYQYIKDEIDKI